MGIELESLKEKRSQAGPSIWGLSKLARKKFVLGPGKTLRSVFVATRVGVGGGPRQQG
jgi:hypothetical protein